ncbi:MAG: Tim44 domain-containing protein [Deltaproteobacteria bacterium]|nr:Tim44 domain-containing protein [Deltaproteobacteria bacterium]
MRRNTLKIMILLAAVLLVSATVLEFEAQARVGGGRSIGSSGTRSYSRSASPTQSTAPPRQQSATNPNPGFQQPAAGGFMRSMAGGIVGGMLGGMLFRSLGFSGMGGGMGGGGIGLFEIILIAGIGYLIYRFIKKRREESANSSFNQPLYQNANTAPAATPLYGGYQEPVQQNDDVETGLGHIRQFDQTFDEDRFNDLVMDNFFKIQGAWMNRDLSPVSGILTDEMRRIMQQDVEKLLRDKQVNRLENIAVRKVEIAEAWQESGQDYINALIYANLLDYTTDDSNGAVISGSKTDPVKFEEYWTFTRPVGNNPWKLSAIDQK